METKTKTMVAMVMSMTSTVRTPATKYTPKWALTTEGIVDWWERNRELRISFKVLRLTERPLRLFAVACCKSSNFWEIAESDVKKALEVIDRYADGKESIDTLKAEHSRMCSTPGSAGGEQGSGWYTIRSLTILAAMFAAAPRSTLADSTLGFLPAIFMKPDHPNSCGDDANSVNLVHMINIQDRQRTAAFAAEHIKQGRLLAGIAAPDWCLADEWRTSTAMALARGIYDERAFDRMPFLADALQDAGCDNDAWLARMRDHSWPWCRGCHILDSLLPELVDG
ncbi:MAG: hypothetical protein K8U57_34350 [Planctomycetes bacterium]|nr:hypothetical protein [Planctomycetota bacterium]